MQYRCLPQGVTLRFDKRLAAATAASALALVLFIIVLLRLRSPTLGLDQSSFAEYGELDQFHDTRAAVYASQDRLMAIVDAMLGDQHKGEGSISRLHSSVDSGDRFAVVASSVSFHDSEGRQLSRDRVLEAIRAARSDQHPVPAVLHYFLRENLTQTQAACIRSAVQLLVPSLVLVWPLCRTSCLGQHWSQLVADASAIGWSDSIVVAFNGQANRAWRSSYDLEWLQVLLPMGGILLDANAYVMQRPPQLLDHRLPVVGRNSSGVNSRGLPNAERISVDVVISPPMTAAMFLWRMALRYQRQVTTDSSSSSSSSSSSTDHWPNYDASLLLQAIADQRPDELVHLEPEMYLGSSGEQRRKMRGYFVRV